MFTKVTSSEKLSWVKTDSATSATGDSDAFMM